MLLDYRGEPNMIIAVQDQSPRRDKDGSRGPRERKTCSIAGFEMEEESMSFQKLQKVTKWILP